MTLDSLKQRHPSLRDALWSRRGTRPQPAQDIYRRYVDIPALLPSNSHRRARPASSTATPAARMPNQPPWLRTDHEAHGQSAVPLLTSKRPTSVLDSRTSGTKALTCLAARAHCCTAAVAALTTDSVRPPTLMIRPDTTACHTDRQTGPWDSECHSHRQEGRGRDRQGNGSMCSADKLDVEGSRASACCLHHVPNCCEDDVYVVMDIVYTHHRRRHSIIQSFSNHQPLHMSP